MPLFVSEEMYESAVSVHVEPEDTLTLTVPFWPEVLTAPLKSELVRFIVRVDKLSMRIFPLIVWFVALRVTLPPFLPELPHFCPSALKKYPDESLFVMLTPERVIVQVVLVARKISPFALVIVPPVMLKAPVPFAASPDWDW